MRRMVRAVALCLAFGLELGVYGSAVLWGVGLRAPVLVRVTAAVAGVTLLAGLWGRYTSPRASRPLAGPARWVFETAWFGTGVAALAAAGRLAAALASVALCFVQAGMLAWAGSAGQHEHRS